MGIMEKQNLTDYLDRIQYSDGDIFSLDEDCFEILQAPTAAESASAVRIQLWGPHIIHKDGRILFGKLLLALPVAFLKKVRSGVVIHIYTKQQNCT